MLTVVSPAKSLDYESELPTKKHTMPAMLEDAQELIDGLREYSPEQVSALMGISEKLGQLNFERYQSFAQPFTKKNARAAVLAFKGDVYQGMNAYSFTDGDFSFAQDHLRILSGLYGLLRPLDLIQPYRLEMGTSYPNERGANLYAFWNEKITSALNRQLRKTKSSVLLNLASQEYFRSVHSSALQAEIVTPVFKDWKNGKYKIISFFAKKARGSMSAFVVRNRVDSVADLANFAEDGYGFSEQESNDDQLVFLRKED